MAHILLVEPSFIIARSYRMALEGRGHSVDHALNAQAGIICADKRTPGVVLLELQMKAHNGIEFLNEFRSYGEWRGVPVIVVSMVHPESLGNRDILKTLGVAGYLYKPQLTLSRLAALANTCAVP